MAHMGHTIGFHLLETNTMAKITKKTTPDAGPRATLAKLEDARALLTTIRQSLDREILKRADDVGNPGVGWKNFGEAARLLEELKTVGDLLGMGRNEVGSEHACPGCGTRDVDRLLIDENEVRCTVCECEYSVK